jgi:MOSC domain-containing protein YiiM
MSARILSIQVSLPQTYGRDDATHPMERTWTTGIYKTPVTEPVWMSKTQIAGDGQADLVYHSGVDRVALVYAAKHYDYWRQEFPDKDWQFGGFGENITVSELDETLVCIGDTYTLGDTVVQVTQPRKPCWKLARRWGMKDFALRVQNLSYIGWYFRVLKEGEIAADMTLNLIERPHPEWTIERANQVMHQKMDDLSAAEALLNCAALGESWKKRLRNRLNKQEAIDAQDRLIGQNE